MSEPHYVVEVKTLVTSYKVGEWCRRPYPGHPKGCPNYGKSPRCPPNAPDVVRYFDGETYRLWLVYSEFDLDAHAQRMKTAHPDWSDRQCRCVLYWQSRSRKQLLERAHEEMRKRALNGITTCPEGMGVNVYATAKLAGLKLEPIKNLSMCRHVALIGMRKEGR